MCQFCAIEQKRVSAEIVFEDELVMAFLDICPIRPGHTQIIPRSHWPCFEDLPPDVAGRIIIVGQRIARVLKMTYKVERVAFLFTGGDVPHAHAHVVPMHDKTDITSRQYIVEEELTFRSTPRASPVDLRNIAHRLRAGMDAAS